MPSPLKSPTTTETGLVPTANGLPVAAVNPPEPFPSSTVTLLLPLIRRGKVLNAIPVEVPHRHGIRTCSHRETGCPWPP